MKEDEDSSEFILDRIGEVVKKVLDWDRETLVDKLHH